MDEKEEKDLFINLIAKYKVTASKGTIEFLSDTDPIPKHIKEHKIFLSVAELTNDTERMSFSQVMMRITGVFEPRDIILN